MIFSWIFLLIVLIPATINATEYDCEVERKFDNEHAYSADDLKKWQMSVVIEENENGGFLSRCSYSTINQKVTCDRYQVDKIVFDQNVKIKKYYVFTSQFDVQLFPDLFFVENNGRGSIAYGKCNVVSP